MTRMENAARGHFGFRFILAGAMVVFSLDVAQAASDLAAYWPFNEGTGTIAADGSGNGNTGTISGAQWTSGIIATALQFGGSALVTVPDNVSLRPTSVTVEAWVYSDSFQLSYAGMFVTKQYGSMASYRLQMNATYSNRLQFVTSNSWGSECVGATALSNHQWHLVDGVWANGTLKVYVDGVLDGSGARSGSPSFSTDPLEIGYADNTGNPFYGKIDEVKIFSSELSADTIAAHFNAVTLPVVPAVPNLSSPLNNASNLPAALTLSWASSLRASSYSLQVSTVASFASLVASLNGVSSLYQTISGIQYGTVFYWRVNAANAGGFSAWCSAWTFTTMPDSTIPVLIPYIPNPTRNHQPIFQWHRVRGASSYSIQVNNIADFSMPLIVDVASDSLYVPQTALPTGPIYWQVKSNIGTRYSAIGTFTIVSDSVPILIPMLPDTQFGMPLFKWYRAAGASAYRIQIDTTGTFSSPLISTLLADSTYIPPVSLPKGMIVWRVGSVATTTQFSSADTFWVRATGVLPDYSGKPSRWGTTFRRIHNGVAVTVSLSRPSVVSLEVVALNGDRIASIYRGMTSAGAHIFSWNGTGREGRFTPTGSYLVVCNIDGNMTTRKITVMR